jgi:hypothetical protein
MKKYIFFVGTGRTGTFYLKHFFEKMVPNTLAVHEPNRSIKFCTNLRLAKQISEKRLHRFLKRFKYGIDKKLDNLGKNVYVQSDPWFFGFLDIIEDYFENPYIIHLVRNPYSYIPSQLNMYYDNPIAGMLRDIIPYWKLRGDQTGDFSKKQWHTLSQEEKVAWYWSLCNRFIDEQSVKLNKYLCVKFEDLFGQNNFEIERILKFCEIDNAGLKTDRTSIKEKTNTQKKRFPSATTWEIEKKEKVRRLCEPLLVKYNYIDSAR